MAPACTDGHPIGDGAHHVRMSGMIRLASTLERTSVPRSCRRRFFDFRVARWLVPALRCFTFPVAVILNRFAAAFFVFCLGME